jgi:pimeloyl-ACP methyl ester carboxylesterase
MSGNPQRDLAFESGDATLVGTLHLPAGNGPHPALVMLQGSGDSDRDSNGYFPPIREHFLRHGLAVYSFDKPGCGASSGDWRRRALRDRAREALDALTLVRAQPEIDARAVGLWGQSQGGWTVPLAAMLAPEIPFIIPQSCPSLTPDEQALYDVEQQLRGAGLAEADVSAGLAYVRTQLDYARRQLPYERVEAEVVAPARGQPWATCFYPESGADWEHALVYAREDYNPLATLRRVTNPILAIFGELDVLLPAARSAVEIERALTEAGNRDVTVRVFPGATHRLKDAVSGEFPPGYLACMTDWLRERVARARSGASDQADQSALQR